MKKITVFILIILLLCGFKLSVVPNLTIDKIFPNASVEVYIPKKVDAGVYKSISNGDGMILFSHINQLKYILNTFNVSGYTLKINMTINGLIKNLNPNFYTHKDGGVLGYKSGLFDKSINGNNFQCAKSDGCLLLGVPMLLGGY